MSLISSTAEFKTLNRSIHTKLVSPSGGCSGEFTSKGQPCKIYFCAHLSISTGFPTLLFSQMLMHCATAVSRVTKFTAAIALRLLSAVTICRSTLSSACGPSVGCAVDMSLPSVRLLFASGPSVGCRVDIGLLCVWLLNS